MAQSSSWSFTGDVSGSFVVELHKGWSWKSSATPGKCPSESCKSCRWDRSNSEPHSTVFCILWLFGKYLLAFVWAYTFVKAKFLIIKHLLKLGFLGNQIYICKHPHTPHQLSVLHPTLKDSCFSPLWIHSGPSGLFCHYITSDAIDLRHHYC